MVWVNCSVIRMQGHPDHTPYMCLLVPCVSAAMTLNPGLSFMADVAKRSFPFFPFFLFFVIPSSASLLLSPSSQPLPLHL